MYVNLISVKIFQKFHSLLKLAINLPVLFPLEKWFAKALLKRVSTRSSFFFIILHKYSEKYFLN